MVTLGGGLSGAVAGPARTGVWGPGWGGGGARRAGGGAAAPGAGWGGGSGGGRGGRRGWGDGRRGGGVVGGGYAEGGGAGRRGWWYGPGGRRQKVARVQTWRLKIQLKGMGGWAAASSVARAAAAWQRSACLQRNSWARAAL